MLDSISNEQIQKLNKNLCKFFSTTSNSSKNYPFSTLSISTSPVFCNLTSSNKDTSSCYSSSNSSLSPTSCHLLSSMVPSSPSTATCSSPTSSSTINNKKNGDGLGLSFVFVDCSSHSLSYDEHKKKGGLDFLPEDKQDKKERGRIDCHDEEMKNYEDSSQNQEEQDNIIYIDDTVSNSNINSNSNTDNSHLNSNSSPNSNSHKVTRAKKRSRRPEQEVIEKLSFSLFKKTCPSKSSSSSSPSQFNKVYNTNYISTTSKSTTESSSEDKFKSKYNYQCSFMGCGRRFKRREHLTRHSMIHTGERPFLCNQCQRRFSRVDNLAQHVRTSHSSS